MHHRSISLSTCKGLAVSALVAALACPAPVPASAPPASQPAQSLPAASASAGAAQKPDGCLPANEGYFSARVRGANSFDINWRGAQLQCEGDPRGAKDGMRLTFVGTAEPGHHRLRFVFGINAAAAAGEQHEVPTNLTLIFEGEKRLYATRGAAQCTIDVLQAQRLRGPDHENHAPLLQVSARGFCIGPAAALEDESVKPRSDAAERLTDALAADHLLVTRFDFAGAVRLAARAEQR